MSDIPGFIYRKGKTFWHWIKARRIKNIAVTLSGVWTVLQKTFAPIWIKIRNHLHLIWNKIQYLLRPIWNKIQYLLRPIWKQITIWLFGSIRIKLAFFTGGLILATIFINSLMNVQQQSQILSESYDREAAISRTYISSLMLELDSIAQSLIRVEEFRYRVKTRRKQLKKYKRTRVIKKQKQVSVFGFKTELFGVLGEKKIRQSSDTYYSRYLSNDDIKFLENATRHRLNKIRKNNVNNQQFRLLQSLARQFVINNQKAQQISAEILLLENEQTNQPINPGDQDKQENNEIKDELDSIYNQYQVARKNAQSSRQNLDQGIIRLLTNATRQRIKQLGLDLNRFRIQSFPLDTIVKGKATRPAMDTSLFTQKTNLNGELKNPSLEKKLIQFLQTSSKKISVRSRSEPEKFKFNGMDLLIQYEYHFRNINSTHRAGLLEILREEPGIWNKYLKQEISINQELKPLISNIENRILELKSMNPPRPPWLDNEFRNFYEQYRKIIESRSVLFMAYREKIKNNKSFNNKTADAIGSLRNSALEDQISLQFQPGFQEVDQYKYSLSQKKARHEKWRMLRKWIYAGKKETPPVWLKKLYTEAMITNSRSEAEKIMWKLDTLPLVSRKNNDVSSFVLDTNYSGIIRTIVNRTEGLKEIESNRNRALLSSFLVAFVSIALAVFVSGFVVRRIRQIISSAQLVGDGNLAIEFEHGGADEFGHLTGTLNHMVAGLREREKMKGVLGSMIDPVVVTEAMKDLTALKRGTQKDITAFFSDIAGFSTISEQLDSVNLAAVLNEYLSAMTIILQKHDGVLDKYIGDAIVGIFNAPLDIENHTLKAVFASLEMLDKMKELRKKWTMENRYIPEVQQMSFRIGLHTGPAKVGFMGTDDLASYTMMGDTVNLAARLEAAGKDYGVNLLVSSTVYNLVSEHILGRKMDLIRVKGKTEPVMIYEIICDLKSAPDKILQSTRIYEEGLELYLNCKWKEATRKLKESEKIKGESDQATTILLDRIKMFQKNNPAENWDGVYTRLHK